MIQAKQSVKERQAAGLGVIERGRIYPKPLFLKLAGMSQAGWRSAVAAGLTVRKHGKRSYVVADDWIAFLSRDAASA